MLIVLYLLLLNPTAHAWQEPSGDEPSWTETIESIFSSGAAEYRNDMISIGNGKKDHRNRIKMTFEPTLAVPSVSFTIDLDERLDLPQAKITLFRVWIANLLTYYRNTDANIKHEVEYVHFRIPALIWDDRSGQYLTGSIAFTVGSGFGTRVFEKGGTSGIFAEPAGAVLATAQLMNRVFATAYAKGSYSFPQGKPEGYMTGMFGAQLGTHLKTRNGMSLSRLILTVNWNYYGANRMAKLPRKSFYVGAGFEWGITSSTQDHAFSLK